VIRRIHHAQITVPAHSELEARDFYIGVLGLVEIPKPDALKARGGFWLCVADTELHVSLEDSVERLRTKAHLAYEVDDLSAWRTKLEVAGCTILKSVEIPGMNRFETRDPFGNRLELLAFTP
jgi:catechol 2,3-dioxygenase-like lactoylglutathione lyase family enzyme